MIKTLFDIGRCEDMSKELIEQELDKLFPTRKQDLIEYRKFLCEKYDEKKVRDLENISNKLVDEIMRDLFG